MTGPRLPSKPVLVSPSRRGGGAGEPAPQPVPPPAQLANAWEPTASEPSTTESSQNEPWLLDSREVSRLLGIGRTKTFQMMASNELPVVRIGRCIRVPRAELNAWIRDQTNLPIVVRQHSTN